MLWYFGDLRYLLVKYVDLELGTSYFKTEYQTKKVKI